MAIIVRSPVDSGDRRDDFEVLYVRRAEREGDPWSGQVSFPGGKQEEIDRGSDLTTAVRETREEIGVDLSSSRFECLGQINDRSAYSRGAEIDLSISAFVFQDKLHTEEDLALRLNVSEISGARWVPSSELISDKVVWDRVEFPFATRIFPALKAAPETALERFGLFSLRFPSLPLHELLGSVAQTESKTEHDLPYNLWGLTFRITEDLLRLAGTPQEETFAAKHPPCLFPSKSIGAICNVILGLMHRYGLKQSY